MFCEKCGYPIQEGGNFCENCGTPVSAQPMDEQEIIQPVAPIEEVAEPAEEPKAPIMQQWQPEQQYAQYSEKEAPQIEPGKTNTGLLVWSIIALVVSAYLSCSCLGVVPLVLSIIALVFVCKAPKETTLSERQSKEKTAKVMLIIATVLLALSIIVYIIASIILSVSSYVFDDYYSYFIEELMDEVTYY